MKGYYFMYDILYHFRPWYDIVCDILQSCIREGKVIYERRDTHNLGNVWLQMVYYNRKIKTTTIAKFIGHSSLLLFISFIFRSVRNKT
jgi:hypothetical protein